MSELKPHHHVVAAVIEKNGRIFCTRRGQTKYDYTSFKYEFPGGKVEPGETEDEALRREIREELNMDVEVGRDIMKTSYDYPDFSVSISFFLCHLKDENAVIKHPEHVEAVWAGYEEIQNLDWVAADRSIARQIQDLVEAPSRRVKCLNCGKIYESMYCPDCGQPRTVKRYNWKEVGRSLTNGFFKSDNGFFYTVKSLFLRPGPFVKDYLSGKRVKSFSPFPYLFVIVACVSLLVSVRHSVFNETTVFDQIEKSIENTKSEMDSTMNAVVPDNSGLNFDVDDKSMQWLLGEHEMLKFIYEQLLDRWNLLILLMMPYLCLILRWFAGKGFRRDYNWPETYVIVAFYIAQLFLIMGIMVLVSFFTPDDGWKTPWETIAGLVLAVWFMRGLVPQHSTRRIIRRTIWGYFFLMFSMAVLVLVAAVIVLAVMAALGYLG